MYKLERLLALIDNVNEWTGKAVSFLCPLMMVVLMWEVVLRYAFNQPTFWAHETSGMLFGAYILLGGGYVLRLRGHVGMDIIYNRFSLKGRAILDLVGSLLFFSFCGVIVWQGGRMALLSVLNLENTRSIWGPPWYPLKLTIPVGAFLILLQGLAKFTRDLIIAVARREAA